MTSDHDSDTSNEKPVEIWRRWQSVLLPAALVAATAAATGLLLGFRGFAATTVAAFDAGQKLLAQAPSAPPNLLATAHPLFDLVAGLLEQLPASVGLGALPFLSILAAAASLPAIWGLGRKLSGTTTAICAAATFAVLPQTTGLATAFLPATIFVFLWCWLLRLLVVERHRWSTTALLWILGGALVLIWPMFLAWGALWLYIELIVGRASLSSRNSAHTPIWLPGELPPATVPIALLLAPIAVMVVATALHPGFWTAPIQGWSQYLQHAVTWTGPAFSYGGTVYEHTRPPLWTGLQLGWWMLPALAAVGTLTGWLSLFASPLHDRRTARLTRKMLLWGVPFALILPWLHRGPSYGDIVFTHVMLPFVALATGFALSIGYRACRAFISPYLGTLTGRLLPAGLVAVGLLSVGLLTADSHPTEGSYYNKLAGGFTGAVETGLPVSRDDVYPLQALRRAQRKIGRATLHTIDQKQLISLYQKSGLLPGVRPTDDPASADALLRRISSFQPAGDQLAKNPGALVEVGPKTTPLLTIDGVPIYWLERP